MSFCRVLKFNWHEKLQCEPLLWPLPISLVGFFLWFYVQFHNRFFWYIPWCLHFEDCKPFYDSLEFVDFRTWNFENIFNIEPKLNKLQKTEEKLSKMIQALSVVIWKDFDEISPVWNCWTQNILFSDYLPVFSITKIKLIKNWNTNGLKINWCKTFWTLKVCLDFSEIFNMKYHVS